MHMKSFLLIYESVILESILSDIDSLNIPDDIKNILKDLKNHNGKADVLAQKAALFWLGKSIFKLPEDKNMLFDSLRLVGSSMKDFQRFKTREDIKEALEANRHTLAKMDAKAKAKAFDPSTEPCFSNPYKAGDGVIIYDVEDSKEGQAAVRTAVDKTISQDSNPWCLIKKEEDGKLGEWSWTMWNEYDAYQKRAAFKNGKIIGFSAKKNLDVGWWDLNDAFTHAIPYSNDYEEELCERGYYHEDQMLDEEEIEEILEKNPWHGLSAYDDRDFEDKVFKLSKLINKISRSDDTDLLRKFASSDNEKIREEVAKNKATPADVLMNLAKDKKSSVRARVAYRTDLTDEAYSTFADDKDESVNRALNLTLQILASDRAFSPKLIVKLLQNDRNLALIVLKNEEQLALLSDSSVKAAVKDLVDKYAKSNSENSLVSLQRLLERLIDVLKAASKNKVPKEETAFYEDVLLSTLSDKNEDTLAKKLNCILSLHRVYDMPSYDKLEQAILKYDVPIEKIFFISSYIMEFCIKIATKTKNEKLLAKMMSQDGLRTIIQKDKAQKLLTKGETA